MKHSMIFCALIFAFAILPFTASSQIKIDIKGKIKKEADRRANKKADEGVKKGFDKMEEGAKDIFKKNDSLPNDNPVSSSGKTANAVGEKENKQGVGNKNTLSLTWNKYDFVPGDKIIFEDNQLGEENGEFPSRWDLTHGNVENALFGEDHVIMFRGGDPTIVPYLKNPEKDYLPDVFTIEFDLYLPNNSFTLYFFDRKNQSRPSGETYLSIWSNGMELRPARSNLPDGGTIQKKWAHISVAYTNGKMKAYVNDTRLINIPHLEFNPSGVSLNAYHANDNRRYYIKNFKIAEGGVKYYDRFLQDGKIVSNGIRFDVNKATLRPESMGVLNEIYKLLDEHPEVNFSIEGHTDSDGDFDFNQKLSEDRAETVMNQLISMGINSGRFTYKGFGEGKPVNSNDTPEGKAANRRVEFVKIN